MTALLLLLLSQAPAPLNAPLIDVQPTEARTGKLLIVDVEVPAALPAMTEVTPTLNGKRGVAFPIQSDRRTWRALVPVDIESAQWKTITEKKKKKRVAATQPLSIEAKLSDGRVTTWSKPVPIVDGVYDKRTITVGKQFTSPSKKQAARAAKEAKEMTEAQKTLSPARLWRGSFAKPTAGPETSPFGTLRTYNSKKKSRHLGLDLDGNVGDPIVAANRGTVIMAKDRFYSGGTVLLDHGQGFLTMYFHMSKIDVAVGQQVEKGQGLGAVGASGQVTGPHLHFSVKLGGEYVDPDQLLALDLSADADDEQK